jgi:hypothetical protein
MGCLIDAIAIAPMEGETTGITLDCVSLGRLVLLHGDYLTIDNSLVAADNCGLLFHGYLHKKGAYLERYAPKG